MERALANILTKIGTKLPRKSRPILTSLYFGLRAATYFGKKGGICLDVELAGLRGRRVKMAFDLSHPGQRLLCLSGMYEEKVTNLFCQLITENRGTQQDVTIVDVGAYIGYFTVLASKLVGEKGTVLAFEPAPDNFRLLKKTIDVNTLENVTLHQKAVLNTIGKASLRLSSNSATHSLADATDGFFIGKTRQTGETLEVDTITLDQIFGESANFPCGNLIVKIDVEGAELKVLQGMQRVLTYCKNLHLICSVHEQKFPAFGYTPRDFFQYLHKYQLDLYLINEHLTPIEGSPPGLQQYDIYVRKHR